MTTRTPPLGAPGGTPNRTGVAEVLAAAQAALQAYVEATQAASDREERAGGVEALEASFPALDVGHREFRHLKGDLVE